ncbi:hypothetical protein LQZ19_11325 [Treponema primitia]|uniref:hypothetical protein n=1 Tax=Treponema primitia TaxID=88058 RepID=UPI00397F6DE4
MKRKLLFLCVIISITNMFIYAGGMTDLMNCDSFASQYIDGDAISGPTVRAILEQARRDNVYPLFWKSMGQKNTNNFETFIRQYGVSEEHQNYLIFMTLRYILLDYFKQDNLIVWAENALTSGAVMSEQRGKRGGNAWIY